MKLSHPERTGKAMLKLRGAIQAATTRAAAYAQASPSQSASVWIPQAPVSQATKFGQVSTVPYDGVPLTIEDMRRMVKNAISGEGSPALRKLVEEIVAGVRPKDYVSECAAIYYWVMTNVRYLRDPVHIEYLMSPMVVLQPTASDRRAGRRARQDDCESLATILAAMCMSIGIPCEFVTISMTNGGFHHVFTVANVKGMKVVLDPVPGPDVQEMLKRTVRHQVWPIEPVRVEGRSGWGVAGIGEFYEMNGRPF